MILRVILAQGQCLSSLYRSSFSIVPPKGVVASAVYRLKLEPLPPPLWAVRLVQSLSTCTRVRFTFFILPTLGTSNSEILDQSLGTVRPLY